MRNLIFGILASVGIVKEVAADTYYTKKCSDLSQPEFQITVTQNNIPKADIDWFLGVLERMVHSGERFKPGETMQVGWMLTKIEQGDNGTLRVLEPDMHSFPIKFVNSVDATIRHLRSQKDSVESFASGSELDFPSIRQSIVVHLNYKKAAPLVLERATSSGADSGWWLSDPSDPKSNQDPSRFTKISLYQFALDRPDLVKFMAFPSGYTIVVDKYISVIKGKEQIFPSPGSFIDRLNAKID
ncbi:MAG: hypothetical protein H7A09_09635 [Oceanospirillaceae bacterium]|nr:hypothetical protein [Oceanospirillaceae bacterium]